MKTRMFGRMVFIVGSMLLFAASSWAASSPKIGWFDFQAVVDQSRNGKQAADEFKRETERLKADMDVKANALKTAKEELDKKKGVMDEAAKNKKNKELQELQGEAQKFYMESEATLGKLRNELMAPIANKVMEIVRKIGKDDKYDYIIERDKGGIVFSIDKDDLTKRLVEELDKTTLKK